MYVSLHNRSAFSFGSTLSMPEDLVAFAAHYRMPAIALTDLDGLYAAIPFYQLCKKAGVTPIIGAEFALQSDRDTIVSPASSCGTYSPPASSCGTGFQPLSSCGTGFQPLSSCGTGFQPVRMNVTLLARGMTGYGNLCRLVSLRQLREAPPTVEDLHEHSDDLICLLNGSPTPQAARGFATHTHSFAQHLRDIFNDRLYIELTIHDTEGTHYARRTAAMADDLGIPVVASCASRCMDRDDHLLLRALQSIGTLTLLDSPHPEKPPGTWHLRTPAEMQRLFRRRPDALRNTLAVAEQCTLEIDLDRNRFPPCSAPPGRTAMQHLRDLCVAGCKWRYIDTLPQKGMGGKRPTMTEALARLDRELAIIEQVHYAEYFLVFNEIVRYCRGQGIATLARGSAADSLVCYALGVSHACPFRFDLPFDRFLNPERARFSKMADIDLDLPWDQRDQVIRWVFDRWGHDRVAMIGLPNTYHARAAVAELGKVFGLPAHEVHKATRLLPHTTAWNIEQAVRTSPEARDFPVKEEPYRTILQLAGGLESLPHHWAMHPCGIVVAPDPLTTLVPVQPSPKGHLVAQYDMDAIEALGFIKIDLLGQAGLSVLRDAVNEIRATEQSDIDLHNDIDYADAATWNMIATGGARGVHHIESPAMISLLRQCNCRDIDCLTAIVAIIRPGAANQGKKEQYARRHQGFEPPQYVHPSLVPVLEKTYGLMVFEEHILQIATEFAGMNLGRADVLRRALNKGNRKLVAEAKVEFAEGARRLGRTDAEIAAVWQQVEGFNGFMFNKAHSAEYAVEAFQGAWLKHRWPAHYLAAILSNYRGFYAHSPTLPQILYVLEAMRLGIGFLPPCVNRSGCKFRVERVTWHRFQSGASSRTAPVANWCHKNGTSRMIRIPIMHIKGLTEAFVTRCLAERDRGVFESLPDFLQRCRPGEPEALALLDSGAFDGFGLPRPRMFWMIRKHLHAVVTRDGTESLWNANTRQQADTALANSQDQGKLLPSLQDQGNLLPSLQCDSLPSRSRQQVDAVLNEKPPQHDPPRHDPPRHDPPQHGLLEQDLPPIDLTAPGLRQIAQREMDLLGFPVSIDPLTLLGTDEHGRGIDWSRYVPVSELDRHHGHRVAVCGLMIADRINMTTEGELMKFVSLADRTGVVETLLFPDAYRRFGHLTAAHPILAVTGIVEPFENRNGFNLRVEHVAPPQMVDNESRPAANGR